MELFFQLGQLLIDFFFHFLQAHEPFQLVPADSILHIDAPFIWVMPGMSPGKATTCHHSIDTSVKIFYSTSKMNEGEKRTTFLVTQTQAAQAAGTPFPFTPITKGEI